MRRLIATLLLLPLAWGTPQPPAQALDLASGAGHLGVTYMLTDQLMRSGQTQDQAMLTAMFVMLLAQALYPPADPVASFGGSMLGAATASRLQLRYNF
jgi:hypothetical protein